MREEDTGPHESPPLERNEVDDKGIELQDNHGGEDDDNDKGPITPNTTPKFQQARIHSGRTPLQHHSRISSTSTPSTPSKHTGRSPLQQHHSRMSTRSNTSIPSTPGTPHISNQRYTFQEGEGSKMSNLFTKHQFLVWIICCATPLVYLLLIFGAIPIGEREDDDDDDAMHIPGTNKRLYRYWVFTCAVNPINMMVISFLNSGIFLSCMGVMRPFRVHWCILLSVFLAEAIVFSAIVPFVGTFVFFGVASLFLCYAVTFAVIYIYETWKVEKMCKEFPATSLERAQEMGNLHKHYWQFVKVACAFLIFFLVLILYVWAFQHVGSGAGQKLLPFGMTVGVFIIRKVMLALTDCFPLDTAMLISGFWVENIYDMFQTMAYRNVKLPINYISIWFTNALSLLANLFFLTDYWFLFRIWIKAYLPLMFTGKCCPYKLGVEPDLTEIPDERGHGNNKSGYHRRQVRFLMYKMFSKIISACFYFLISTVLRYGMNRRLFPFESDTFEEYENSLQFCAYNLIFLCLAAVGAAIFIRWYNRPLFDHFVANRRTLRSRYMLGTIVALLINNGIIAVSMMMYFNQIWNVVRDDA